MKDCSIKFCTNRGRNLTYNVYLCDGHNGQVRSMFYTEEVTKFIVDLINKNRKEHDTANDCF